MNDFAAVVSATVALRQQALHSAAGSVPLGHAPTWHAAHRDRKAPLRGLSKTVYTDVDTALVHVGPCQAAHPSVPPVARRPHPFHNTHACERGGPSRTVRLTCESPDLPGGGLMAGPTPRAWGSCHHKMDDNPKSNSRCALLLASLSPPRHRALGHALAHASEDAWGEGREVAACGGRAKRKKKPAQDI